MAKKTKHDCTIPPGQHAKMLDAFEDVKARLDALKEPLGRMMQSQPEKVKAFAETDAGRLLRDTVAFRDWLDQYFDSVGWWR